MPVDRCVCFKVSFAELQAHALEHQCGLEGLCEHFGCGRGCALCLPYITAMLETGLTSLPVDLSTVKSRL